MSDYTMISKKEEARLTSIEKEAYSKPNTWINIFDNLRIRFIPNEGLECHWGATILKRGY